MSTAETLVEGGVPAFSAVYYLASFLNGTGVAVEIQTLTTKLFEGGPL